MKKYLFIATFFTAILGFAQTSMNVSSFSKIKIEADAEVEVVYSTKNQVMLSSNEQESKSFIINSEDDMLHIKQNDKTIPKLRIRIYTNNLKAMELTGAGNVKISKFDYLDSIYLSMKGKYIVNTGETKIKHLVIARDSRSKAIYTNVKTIQESVNGALIAAK